MGWKQIRIITLAIAIVLGTFAQSQMARAAELETTVLADSCFWCMETDFKAVAGAAQ